MANSVTLKFGYTNTEFTRQYKIENVATADLEDVKEKVLAVNASLKAGTADGLEDFFRSDDYDATDSENVIGKFNGIVAAQYTTSEVTDIDLT